MPDETERIEAGPPVVQDEQQPDDEPEAVAADPEEEDMSDTLPLTVEEVAAVGKEVVDTVKNGFLMPVYRLGRRYLRGAQSATESFFDGVVNEKEKK